MVVAQVDARLDGDRASMVPSCFDGDGARMHTGRFEKQGVSSEPRK